MERIYTIDCVTGKKIEMAAAIRCVTDFVHNHFVFGHTRAAVVKVRIYCCDSWQDATIPEGMFQDHLVFHRGWSAYFLDFNVPVRELVFSKYAKESGYPYSFGKKYEAVENFNIFKGKQSVIKHFDFPIAKYFKYSFGLEFETSTGIIPEELCFRDGLIPLRDGSISGNEYSTVVLQGDFGFNLLKQQIETLREYTRFDKECSLHIHMGGFPLEPEKILSLYNLCYSLQNQFKQVLPSYTFYTAKYKASQKDYCKLLPGSFNTFEDFYKAFVGVPFFGDLQQPHPHDVERARKWQIHERYYWANLLNLICYRVNKTMEFRMLRPTYNLEKILFWMYIFNAILQYAEKYNIDKTAKISITEILTTIYPEELARELLIDFYKCEFCSTEQSRYGDMIGARLDLEEEVFDKNRII